MSKTDSERLKNIKNHIYNGEYETAKKKCRKNFNNRKFITCYIKILLLEGNLDEAEKVCLENLNDMKVLSQYLIILCMKGRYSEVIDYCEKHMECEQLMTSYINALSHFNELEKIKEIGEKYPYNKYICKQYALALIKNGLYSDALRVCKRHTYDNKIQRIYNLISERINENDEDVLINYNFYITSKINELIVSGNLIEAKELCLKNMDVSGVFELYLLILNKQKHNNKILDLKLE